MSARRAVTARRTPSAASARTTGRTRATCHIDGGATKAGVAPDEANDAPETPEEKKILDELEKNEAPKSNSNIDKDDDN